MYQYNNNVSWTDRFCAKHPRFGISNLMRYIVIANVVVYVLDMFSSGALSSILAFYPSLVLQGQLWRLVTFFFVPESYSLTGLGPVWFFFSMMFYYFLGTSMEREWGTAKFNLFYLCGALLTLIFGFLSLGLCQLLPDDFAQLFAYFPFTMGQVNFSLLLAFATCFPDVQFRIYFLIPIRAKWLAVLYLLMQLWSFMRMSGIMLLTFGPITIPPLLASLINYAIFFAPEIKYFFLRTKRQNSKQVINFKKAQKQAQKKAKETGGFSHKCAVCGVTDADDPNMEFRYCSKCDGYYCYCMDHINNHVHIHND